MQPSCLQRFTKILQNFRKKVLRKSCRTGKSAYLCNRFREGEPLKNDKLVKRGRLSKALHPSILPCKTARERETDKPREVLLKKNFEKKLRKNLEGKKKRLTFATAFPLKRELKKR